MAIRRRAHMGPLLDKRQRVGDEVLNRKEGDRQEAEMEYH